MTSGVSSFFFFNDTATTEIYTLSLHDALPILRRPEPRPGPLHGLPRGNAATRGVPAPEAEAEPRPPAAVRDQDRKSTRLNSSHANISYAVFCLKKKKNRTHLPFNRLKRSPYVL